MVGIKFYICQVKAFSCHWIISILFGKVLLKFGQIIMKSLDPLRAKKIFIRKKLGHTAVSAIKASSVTLQTWQKEPVENTVNLQF